jgi:hypothetical protein
MFYTLSASFTKKGICVHTGNADGIDNAVVFGAKSANPKYLYLYLPWKTFNSHYFSDCPQINIIEEPSRECLESVPHHHPNPKYLSQGAYKLHARNYGIIMEPKVDLVIAYPNDSNLGGGTYQGIRIAQCHNIPVYNLRLDEDKYHLKLLLKDLELL